MLTPTTPYVHLLGNNLILKSIHDNADVDRLAAFNGHIFDQTVAEMSRQLIAHHPSTRPEHWLYIEDETTGQIVSSLALIPWQWRYEDVTLKVGEMGIVGTREAYRHRGLVRALAARHRELLHEGDFDLSNIQGIPYYYRQFGYEYALPLEPGWHLELQDVPEVPTETLSKFSFRPATTADIAALTQMYDDAARSLDISAIRSTAIWQYLLQDAAGSAMAGQCWLVLDAHSQPAGYFRIMFHGFGKGLIVSETSRHSQDISLVMLHHLKALAREHDKPSIRFNLPLSNDLLRTAQGCGADNTGTYAWQMLVVDAARLLRKITPVLERRIAASSFNSLTQRLIINLYREAFELRFEAGKLLAVKALGFSDQWGIRLPPPLFAPLVLGYRSPADLSACYHDVQVLKEAKPLVDVLFPGMDSFIYTIY